jgi:hypothetical protein
MMAESGDVDASTPPEAASTRQTSATVGTGSSLAIGCVIVVLLLILIALALRAFTPLW